MGKVTIPAMVDGGKATAGPPLGPALGAAKVNIGLVLADINKKTEAFAGMQVPVKVIINTDDKSYEIVVGTPPVSALIKKEIGIKENIKEEPGTKGKKVIGNITIPQMVKIAKMKESATLAKTTKAAVKEITGTCLSLGVTVEGLNAKEAMKLIAEGKYDDQLKG